MTARVTLGSARIYEDEGTWKIRGTFYINNKKHTVGCGVRINYRFLSLMPEGKKYVIDAMKESLAREMLHQIEKEKSSGGAVYHWDCYEWTLYDCLDGGKPSEENFSKYPSVRWQADRQFNLELESEEDE